MIVEVLIIFVLIILNGIFSMSEIALVSSKNFLLKSKAESGDKGAKKALELSKNPGKFLSTVQVGITLIGILTGVYGGASIAETLSDYFEAAGLFSNYSEHVSTLIVVVFITYFTLIFGELFPKRLGLNTPEKISSFVALPMTILSTITKPIIWLLNGSTELLIKIFRIKPNEENFITEEEIRSMLEQATEVDKAEKEMVERVFFLGDTDAGSLMTSRNEVVLINVDDEVSLNMQIMAESNHSHFPVYENSTDNIIGILSLKSLSLSLIRNEVLDIRKLLKPALYVNEATKAFKLLERMKENDTQFTVAVNEYGSFMGVVTINDLFKVIAGNLYKSSEDLEIVKRQDGSFLVDGLISLDEFFRYFNIEDTKEIENKGFYTLGGLILYLTSHIPKASEKLKWRNLTFEIIDMDGQRVDKILVKYKNHDS